MRRAWMALALTAACRSDPDASSHSSPSAIVPAPTPTASMAAAAPTSSATAAPSATPTASAAPPSPAAHRFDGPPDPGVPSDAEVPVSAWRFGRPDGWKTTAYYKRDSSLYLETQNEGRGGRLYAREQTAAPSKAWLDQETYLAGAFQVKWAEELDTTVGAEHFPAKLAFGRGKSMDHPSQVRQVVRLLVRGGDTTLLAMAIWKEGDAATASDIEASVRGLTRVAR